MGGWVSEYYPYSDDTTARQRDAYVYDNPSVTTNLSLSPSSPVIGQPVTASFSVKNNSNVSVTIPAIGVAVRDSRGNNVGYPSDTNVVIAAGSTYTYSKTRAFTGNTGTYKFFITSLYNGNWDDNYPMSLWGLIRSRNTDLFN